ncbi:MAG TPA: SURF1 family protein [Rhizomicrobium sp.]|jgi:surfeit locus 1 family protein|nr:SURF1 family protein [Rhizomicrobium sp.]
MRLHFRPLTGFTLLCLPMFLLLVGLGVWQLERLQWKLGLIAEMTRNMAAAPIGLDAALALGDRAQYRPVAVTGRLENSKEIYVFTTGPNGAPVYHVLTPLMLLDGRGVLIDRGFVPATLLDPASRPGSEPQGIVHVVGIWRRPDKPGLFTPPPDLNHRVWFARDLSGIRQRENLKLVAPAILEEKASPAGGPWPRGGQTRVDLPNDHLQYALTWFLLAGALVVVYFAYHRARGQLTFSASRQSMQAEN